MIRGADFETEFVAARFVERAGELRSLPDFDVVQIPYARRVLRGCELEGYGQVFPCRDIVYGGIARRPLSKDRGERFLGDGRVGVLFSQEIIISGRASSINNAIFSSFSFII